jgi:hypothetical protein
MVFLPWSPPLDHLSREINNCKSGARCTSGVSLCSEPRIVGVAARIFILMGHVGRFFYLNSLFRGGCLLSPLGF